MLSGERSLYWKLTARENLEYFAALYHVPPREQRARIGASLAAVQLVDRADDYVERYSTGMRQRLALARALLPDPPLVILDEPTVGLDPQAARDLRDRVRELKRQGRTVLLTTHYMEEADALCDRVGLMHHGLLRAVGAPDELKAELGPGASLEDVFRHYTGDQLGDSEKGGLRGIRSTRRTAGRMG
jgi:ABC-2 type transport system ATP-binding protein